MFKVNFLYNVAVRLHKEKDPVFSSCSAYLKPIEHKDSTTGSIIRKAIIIDITSPPEKDLDLNREGYRYHNRHVTVDYLYLSTRLPHHPGFEYCLHYKETYTNGRDFLEIRTYLDDKKRPYIDAKICSPDPDDEKKHTYTSYGLSSNKQDLLLANSKIAGDILFKLLQEQKRLYTDWMEESYKLEDKLCEQREIYLNNSTVKNLENYKKTMEYFNLLIEKINRLLSVDKQKDMRATFIKKDFEKMLEFAQNQASKKVKNPVKKDDDSDNEIECLIDTTKHLKLSKPKEKNPIDKLKALSIELESYSAKPSLKWTDLINIKEIIEKIQNESLCILLDQENLLHKNEKIRQFVLHLRNTTYATNKQIILQLYDAFKQACLNGDFEAVKLIFEHVQSKIDEQLLLDILASGINLQQLNDAEAQKTNRKIVNILTFLFKQSPLYKLVITTLDTTRCYLQFNIDVATGPDSYKRYHIKITTLIILAMHNNLLLFKLLLEQGIPVNQPSLLFVDSEQKMLEIKACCYITDMFNLKNINDFINLLLQYGAMVNESNMLMVCEYQPKVVSEIPLQQFFSIAQRLANKSSRGKLTYYSLTQPHTINLTSLNPALFYFVNGHARKRTLLSKDIDFLKDYLIKRSDVNEILLALGQLVFFYCVGMPKIIIRRSESEGSKRNIFFNSDTPEIPHNTGNPTNIVYMYSLNSKLSDQKTRDNMVTIINLLYDQLITIFNSCRISNAHEKINLFVNIMLLQNNTIKEQMPISSYTDNILVLFNIISLRSACLNVARWLFSVKASLTTDDIEQIKHINIKLADLYDETPQSLQIQLFNGLSTENPEQTANRDNLEQFNQTILDSWFTGHGKTLTKSLYIKP